MACGSGLKAIDLAFRQVRDGDAEVVLAGGTESMSRVPYLLTGARWGYRMGDQPAVDAMYQDGFLCPLAEQLMGETAERLAEIYAITREEQDAFALRSQERAAKALAEGRFDAETVPGRRSPARRGRRASRGTSTLAPDTTLASLAKLAARLQAGRGRGHGGQLVGHHRRRRGARGACPGSAPPRWASSPWRGSWASPPPASIRASWGSGVVPAVQALLERLGPAASPTSTSSS